MAQAGSDPETSDATRVKAPWVLVSLNLPERSWWGPVARGITRLIHRSRDDRWALWRSNNIIETDEAALIARARESYAPLRLDGLQDQYELIATLNDLGGAPSPPPLALLLAHLALELHLLQSSPLAVKELSSIVRGLLEAKNRTPGFKLALGGVSNLRTLTRTLSDFELSTEPVGHKGFAKLWGKSLRGTVADLLRNGERLQGLLSSAGSHGLARFDPDTLTIDLDLDLDLDLDVDVDVDVDVEDMEHDEPLSLNTQLIGETAADEPAPRPYTTLATAKANDLARRGRAAVMLDPDTLLPASLGSQALDAAKAAFQRNIEARDVGSAIESLFAMLAITVGASDAELMVTTFGTSPEIGPVIDLAAGTFLRPEIRPRKAFTPKGIHQDVWLPTGGAIPMALPQSVLNAARTTRNAMPVGSTFLSSDGPEPRRVFVRATLNALLPDRHLLPGMFRQRIAATIAEELGIEAAQVTFGDSFGLSASPCYYGRWSAADLCAAAWKAVAPVAAEMDSFRLPETASMPLHHVGSRAAVEDSRLSAWSSVHRTDRRRAAQRENISRLEAWRLTRDCFAALFLAGTAHRPGQVLAEIRLYDLIPEHCIGIFWDKKTDPAHLTRVAGISPRLLAELRKFLDLLVRCRRLGSPALADLAGRILMGEAPLLTVPGADGDEPLQIDDLRTKMPVELKQARNLQRQRLNQQLIARGLDPEVRHQQLGWILTIATATSDCSPNSARDFGLEIAPALDACLLHDGWVAEHPRPPAWKWDGVPLPALVSWSDTIAAHKREHVSAQRKLKQDIVEAGKALLEKHEADLHTAITTIHPELVLVREKSRFALFLQVKGAPIEVTEESAAAIFHLASKPDQSPAAAHVLRGEFVRLLRRGRVTGVTKGFIPACLRISESSVPSPFLKGTGLAVRQAEVLRETILGKPDSSKARKGSDDTGVRVLLSVLCFSPHRSIELARRIMTGASGMSRGASEPGHVRVPVAGELQAGHIVLTGLAAQALLAWNGSEAKREPPSDAALATWLKGHAPALILGIDDSATIVERLEQTLQVAGRVELSGPERLIMLNEVAVTAVSQSRAIGRLDCWPASQSGKETIDEDEEPFVEADPQLVAMPRREAESRSKEWRAVSNLIAAFESEVPRNLPETGTKVGQQRHGRKGKILREIEAQLDRWGDEWTAVRVVLAYLLHLGTEGGSRKRHLRPSTIATKAWRFARPFVEICGSRNLSLLLSEELESIYVAVLLTRSLRWRPRVLESLRHFHWFAAAQCGLPEMEWAALAQLAGVRLDGVDAGVLWESEIATTLSVLQRDLAEIEAIEGADLDEVLLRQQRIFALVVGEAAGVRPATIRGLTFGDLHFLPTGDYIRVRSTGEYGSAKTANSLGFVRLEGHGWVVSRGLVIAWVAVQASRLGNAIADCPVFGTFDQPRNRHSKSQIFGRIGTILKWASGELRAKPYWLRKTRLMNRHASLHNHTRLPRSRDVYRVLAQSGHADIVTPLKSYLHDPALASARHLARDVQVTRADTLAMTGWKPVTLDQGIQRHRAAVNATPADTERMIAIVRAMGPLASTPPPSSVVAPPPCNASARGLRLRDIDKWLRAYQDSGSASIAGLIAGVPASTVDALVERVEEFELRTGFSLVGGNADNRMNAPRRLEQTKLPDIEESDTLDQVLVAIAQAWVPCASRVRLDAGIPVPIPVDRARAMAWFSSRNIQVSERIHGRKLAKVPTLLPLRGSSGGSGGRIHTLWPQLSWLLLLQWIARDSKFDAPETGIAAEKARSPE